MIYEMDVMIDMQAIHYIELILLYKMNIMNDRPFSHCPMADISNDLFGYFIFVSLTQALMS